MKLRLTTIKVPNRAKTVHDDNEYITWTKQGYFRIFNGIRIGVIDLDKSDQSVLLSIVDDITGNLMTNNILIHTGEAADFQVNGNSFRIKFKEIKHAGNVLNIGNWNAAFLEYSITAGNEKLTEYF